MYLQFTYTTYPPTFIWGEPTLFIFKKIQSTHEAPYT